MTLLAVDRGQELSERTAPCEAFVIVLGGEFAPPSMAKPITAAAGRSFPCQHQCRTVEALTASRMMLGMLRK